MIVIIAFTTHNSCDISRGVSHTEWVIAHRDGSLSGEETGQRGGVALHFVGIYPPLLSVPARQDPHIVKELQSSLNSLQCYEIQLQWVCIHVHRTQRINTSRTIVSFVVTQKDRL